MTMGPQIPTYHRETGSLFRNKTLDEARPIASNIAKLHELLGRGWASTSVGALFISARCGRPPGFASEAQVSWMIFSSRRFEKLDYPVEK